MAAIRPFVCAVISQADDARLIIVTYPFAISASTLYRITLQRKAHRLPCHGLQFFANPAPSTTKWLIDSIFSVSAKNSRHNAMQDTATHPVLSRSGPTHTHKSGLFSCMSSGLALNAPPKYQAAKSETHLILINGLFFQSAQLDPASELLLQSVSFFISVGKPPSQQIPDF